MKRFYGIIYCLRSALGEINRIMFLVIAFFEFYRIKFALINTLFSLVFTTSSSTVKAAMIRVR